MSTKPLDIDALADELLPELLPDIVLDISNLIGYKTTLKLVQAFGGVDFAIPFGAADSVALDKLTAVVGAEAAKQLTQEYGSEKVYIPRCHAALTQLRNVEFRQKVLAAVAGGSTQTAAMHLYMRQYGFSERWAYVVLRAESNRADTQLSLFDN
ncbi:MAG: hypothetical protein L0G41_02600 [Psychrobacter sp.]|nr:hypothetical protein [Psychrobacter sp.]